MRKYYRADFEVFGSTLWTYNDVSDVLTESTGFGADLITFVPDYNLGRSGLGNEDVDQFLVQDDTTLPTKWIQHKGDMIIHYVLATFTVAGGKGGAVVYTLDTMEIGASEPSLRTRDINSICDLRKIRV